MRKLTAIAATSMLGIMMTATAIGVHAEGQAGGSANTQKLSFDEAAGRALEDAGLAQGEVTFSKIMNDFDGGTDIYEVDFLVPGQTKFDYKIDAASGAVMEKEAEAWDADDDADYNALLNETAHYFDFGSGEATGLIDSSMEKAMEEAAPAAGETMLPFKAGMEYDNGMVLCEVGFLIPDKMKYEYAFDARTGQLMDTEKENWEDEYNSEYAALLEGNAAGTATGTADAAQGQASLESAKATALGDAGFAEGEVRITKCGKDFDDGMEKIDVEFVGPDGREYDYEISAADGSILSKEAEYDD